MPSTRPPPPGAPPAHLAVRLQAEIVARDRYIQNLAARNLLLRMQVRELKWEVKRLRMRRGSIAT